MNSNTFEAVELKKLASDIGIIMDDILTNLAKINSLTSRISGIVRSEDSTLGNRYALFSQNAGNLCNKMNGMFNEIRVGINKYADSTINNEKTAEVKQAEESISIASAEIDNL